MKTQLNMKNILSKGKVLLAMLVFALFANVLLAAPVDAARAKKIAQKCLGKIESMRSAPAPGGVLNVMLRYQSKSGDKCNFYVFSGNNSFVIISADDRAIPILGYSNESDFEPDNMPENLKDWLYGYENEFEYLRSQKMSTPNANLQKQWAELESELPNVIDTAMEVQYTVGNKLIQTTWNQGAPYSIYCDYQRYNLYCPHSGANYTYVGCVATAMAQIIRY